MPHAFNESGHRFGQFGDFTQVENFEKPWFLVVLWKNHYMDNVSKY